MTPPPGLQDLRRHFGFVEADWGFALVEFTDQPQAFDNFVARYERAPFALCITRERGQVFIELRHGNGPWHASVPLLARLGLSMQRRPTMDDGAWSGWGIAPQAQALQCHGLQLLHILQNP